VAAALQHVAAALVQGAEPAESAAAAELGASGAGAQARAWFTVT